MLRTAVTNAVTMLRHPWARIQSDYYYMRAFPETKHLSPEIDVSHVLTTCHSPQDYALYPGVSNCATKIFNGIPCGDASVTLTSEHLEIAKESLMHLLFIGIMEHYRSSLCVFTWMYGGSPSVSTLVTQVIRGGTYPLLSWDDLDPSFRERFREQESMDLQLYSYAYSLFVDRLALTNCTLE